MLHSILLISTSGIVLFVKEFTQGAVKPRQLGGILTAMLKFSVQKTGLPVAYIQMEKVCVSVTSSEAKVTCAVFHDPEDGAEFGRVLSKELLYSFVNTFSAELQEKHSSPDVFAEFSVKIPAIIRESVKPLLEELSDQRGINLVVLSSGDSLHHATQEVDKLAVLANHQALLGVATDLMGTQNDVPNSITLRSRRTTLVLLRIERASLIVVYKNSVDSQVCMKEIKKTADLVEKVLIMASNLKT